VDLFGSEQGPVADSCKYLCYKHPVVIMCELYWNNLSIMTNFLLFSEFTKC
jgi:hypothetical protein